MSFQNVLIESQLCMSEKYSNISVSFRVRILSEYTLKVKLRQNLIVIYLHSEDLCIKSYVIWVTNSMRIRLQCELSQSYSIPTS